MNYRLLPHHLPEKKIITWTIAGSDPSAGAGLQSDLLTVHDFGLHGASLSTITTAQHSDKTYQITPLSPEMIEAQLNALKAMGEPAAIKIGALGNHNTLTTLLPYLSAYRGPIIYDSVFQTSSGGALCEGKSLLLIKEKLFPLLSLLTPNIPEAERLLDCKIQSYQEMAEAAAQLVKAGISYVLIKGGHFEQGHPVIFDYVASQDHSFWIAHPRLTMGQSKSDQGPSANGQGNSFDLRSIGFHGHDTGLDVHGTGCALSSAITAALSLGYEIKEAIVIGKMYLSQGIRLSYSLDNQHPYFAHAGFPSHQIDLPTIYHSPRLSTHSFPSCDTPIGFYPIVDTTAWVNTLLHQGVKTLQLRIKDQPLSIVESTIETSVALAQSFGARLFINDYWELAIKYKAYGVHLGQTDLETADLFAIQTAGLRLGISTHSFYEIATAHAYSPSYIAYGPIYHTTSKVMPFTPRGLQSLRYWTQLLHYPVVAIGGIGIAQAKDVSLAGADGVSVISAITQSKTIESTTETFLSLC